MFFLPPKYVDITNAVTLEMPVKCNTFNNILNVEMALQTFNLLYESFQQ